MPELENWERLSEVQPSDQFVCTYGGYFAHALALDRHSIEKFLSIASLDGRLLVQETRTREARRLPGDVNPDGSALMRQPRLGQGIGSSDHESIATLIIEKDQEGWVMSINGDAIAEDLKDNSNLSWRQMQDRYASRLEHSLEAGLAQTLLKDKISFEGDPYFVGRLTTSFTEISMLIKNLFQFSYFTSGVLMADVIAMAFFNIIFRSNLLDKFYGGRKIESLMPPIIQGFLKVVNPLRKNVKIFPEIIDTPFEFDRLFLALGYLGYLSARRYLGNPLIRATN